MQLRWKASFSASCLHAATSMHEGLPIADSKIAGLLQAPVAALTSELTACGFAVEATLPLLAGLAADFENNRQLIERAAQRIQGAGAISGAAISRLAGCIADLEAAWLREQPNLVEELAVRGRPLRESWEARGPGLLRAAETLTVENFIAPAAEIVLVSPMVGGHGRAYLSANQVAVEAVLTNPHEDLPEFMRLGWLLAQLHLDLPVLSEPIPPDRLPQLASVATLPLVLAAAESVELATLDQQTLDRAIQCWYLPSLPADAATTLLDWWSAYRADNIRWPVAMAALAQMLGSA
ncbi:MAG: hypothetical protein ACR2NM_16920 [Bythopirellula sp.]